MEIKSCLKTIGVNLVKNGCGFSGNRTLILAAPLEVINGINGFLCVNTKKQKPKVSIIIFG